MNSGPDLTFKRNDIDENEKPGVRMGSSMQIEERNNSTYGKLKKCCGT